MIGLYLHYYFIFTLAYFTALASWYLFVFLLAIPQVLSSYKETLYSKITTKLNTENIIPITVLMPAFNEEKRIIPAIEAIMGSDFKNIQLIIINDGSTSNFMEILIKELKLFEIPKVIKQSIQTCTIKHYYSSRKYPNLRVIDKERSPYFCAADANNAGLNACTTPIVMTIDADTIVEPEAFSRLLFAYLSTSHCVCVSGSVYVLNDNTVINGKLETSILPKKFLTAEQAFEYLRSFIYGRTGLNYLGGSISYPGAFTLFETALLREVGGFDTQNFAYDAEIIMRFQKHMLENKYPYKIILTPNAFAWTEVPSSYKSYWNQRDHWQRGMLRSGQQYLSMFLNPRYKLVGLLVYPAYIVFEIFGSIVEFFSYISLFLANYLGILNFHVAVWYIILAWGYFVMTGIGMYLLNQLSFDRYKARLDVITFIYIATSELFWFRFYRGLCCTYATVKYVFKRLVGKPL